MVKKNAQQEKKKGEQLKKTINNPPKGEKRETEPYRCSLHHLCAEASAIKALIQKGEQYSRVVTKKSTVLLENLVFVEV
ncbi:hypothetical protein C5167_049212 [Papaver somniferum]|uniref:Uncharacterized protein n=1 Tax=Papaver somniferum TaxID=3469 RepID=A0A4Y7KNH6_PAPSO|nr:hypothetical protein C5167_049212 [Papaver somniferum]